MAPLVEWVFGCALTRSRGGPPYSPRAKLYRHGRHKESTFRSQSKCCRQDGDGMCHRDEASKIGSFSMGYARRCHVLLRKNLGAWLYDLLKPRVTKLWSAIRGGMPCFRKATRMTALTHGSWPTWPPPNFIGLSRRPRSYET